MYNFGIAVGVKLRSSILFAIGKGQEALVYSAIKSDVLLTALTMVPFSVCFGLSRRQIASLYFSASEMQTAFSQMVLFYSTVMILDTFVPVLMTLIRTFDMNFLATCLIFLSFGVPLCVLTYLLVAFAGLEYFSPNLSLLVCNVLTIGGGLFLLCRNARANLRGLLQKSYEKLTDVE